MSGIKFDAHKPCSYLLAHDVVIHDTEPGQGIEFYAARLRAWWNRAGTLPALQLGTADYFGTVKILEYGARKYSERNWEEGISYSRVFRAAMDHYVRRGDNDAETGYPHRWHFLCCYMFLAAYTARGLHQFDDRPGVGPFVTREQMKRQVKEAVAAEVILCAAYSLGHADGQKRAIDALTEAPNGYGVFWKDPLPEPYQHLSGLRAEYLRDDYATRVAAEKAIAEREKLKLVEPGKYVVRPL
jgi:hypothetical protein